MVRHPGAVLTGSLRSSFAGIMLEYQKKDGTRAMKEIDLLHLTAEYVAWVLSVGVPCRQGPHGGMWGLAQH